MTIVFDFVYEIYDNDNGSAILHYLKKKIVIHIFFYTYFLVPHPLLKGRDSSSTSNFWLHSPS